jgi:hypothetical protein
MTSLLGYNHPEFLCLQKPTDPAGHGGKMMRGAAQKNMLGQFILNDFIV